MRRYRPRFANQQASKVKVISASGQVRYEEPLRTWQQGPRCPHRHRQQREGRWVCTRCGDIHPAPAR